MKTKEFPQWAIPHLRSAHDRLPGWVDKSLWHLWEVKLNWPDDAFPAARARLNEAMDLIEKALGKWALHTARVEIEGCIQHLT